MPAIPTYDQRIGASGAGAGNIAQPQPNGLGEGLQAIGVGLRAVNEAEQMLRRQDDATKATQQLSDLQMKSAQAFEQAKSQAADDPTDFTPKFMSGFDDLLSETVKGASPRVSALVREHALALKTKLYGDALGFETDARRTYRANAAIESANKASVALQLDPSQWQATGAAQMQLIDAMGFEPEQRMKLKKQVDQSLTEAAATGIAKQAPLVALANLQKADSGDPRFDGLTPDARARVAQQAQNQVVQSRVTGVVQAFANGGPKAASAAIGLAQKDLPPELQDDVQAQVNEKISAIRTQRRTDYAQGIAKVESSIAMGTAGRATHQQVDGLYQAGALTPAEYASYGAQIDRGAVERAGNEAAAAEIRNSLASGIPLDPSNTEQRKALSAAFKADSTGQEVGSASWQALATAYAARTRMVPDQATSWVRSAIRSPNPDIAGPAAQFLGSIQAAAPDAASSFDTQTKAFAGVVSDMVNAGAAPKDAVETARQNVFEIKQPIIDQRKKEYSGSGKLSLSASNPSALKSFISKDFDQGWFHSDPVPTQGLSADFDTQTENYYLKTGDINVARKLAWQDVSRVYGPSEVNGTKQVMMLPPERFGIPAADVRKDIEAFVSGKHEPPASPEGLKSPGNIDIHNRPHVKNADGSISTVRSMSFGTDQGEVLVPTVSEDGRIMSDQEAVAQYQKTGRHLGIFDSPAHADAYAEALHRQQAADLAGPIQLEGGATAKDILVVPDAITQRQLNSLIDGQPISPSYQLINGKTGEPIYGANGIRQRYTLPSGEELGVKIKAAQDKATADAKASVDKARADRLNEQQIEEFHQQMQAAGYRGQYD